MYVQFDVHVIVRHVKFLIIKLTRCTNFSNLFLEWNSTCFAQILCPSSGVLHCTHSNGICHSSSYSSTGPRAYAPDSPQRMPVAARLLRSWARIPPGGMDICLLWVVCCQVEVSATSWSLVQRSPTDCGASLCDLETSIGAIYMTLVA